LTPQHATSASSTSRQLLPGTLQHRRPAVQQRLDRTGATYTTDGSIAAVFGTGPHHTWALDTITVTFNKNARLQITVYETGLCGSEAMMWRVQSSPVVPITIPVNAIVRPAVTTFNSSIFEQVKIREVHDTDKTGVDLNVWASGWTLTGDLDYSAEKDYLHIGARSAAPVPASSTNPSSTTGSC
jgi:hypothetical protein